MVEGAADEIDKLRTENAKLTERVEGYESNSIKQSEYCEFLEAKWQEAKERIAELEDDTENPEWLQERMERIRKHGRVNDPRQAPEDE